MNNIQFTSFHISRYRSLMDVKIEINDQSPIVICGENNIGKTNFLRALNVFFNHFSQPEIFNPEIDIPHHIYDGSRGAGSRTDLTGVFIESKKKTTIKVTFDNKGDTTYLLQGKTATGEQVEEFLSAFQFLLVESHNVDLPHLISAVLERDGLLKLDKKRKQQTQPLEKLKEFIVLSETAIADIEKGINTCFSQLTDFDGILQDKEIKIIFAEFERLRDVVKTMTSITLFDGNSHGIASKGSGAQRAVFLALMQYISKNSKKNVIWGIDEPEAFLQPRLQKKVAGVLSDIVRDEKQPVILTTHSQHFVDLNNLSSTHLFKGVLEPRTYKRKPGITYFEIDTAPVDTSSSYEKAMLIKQHLGISNNDGWEVLPYNILVEGEEDKKYLEILFAARDIAVPNIIWSGGASKIGGYLQFYNLFSKDLGYKPKFICIFDHDNEGRDQALKIKPKSYSYMDVQITPLIRHDGALPSAKPNEDWEIEDFLPYDLIIEVINFVLRKEDYKQISKKQISARVEQAHNGKQILKYAEECCNHNNPDKAPLELDNEGRKKQICQTFHKVFSANPDRLKLTAKQISFLESIRAH